MELQTRKMAKTGLLVLTQPLSHLKLLVPKVITEAASVVSDTLYICLQPVSGNKVWFSPLQFVACTEEIKHLISLLYSKSNVCHTLDIRVLLSHICTQSISSNPQPYSLKKEVHVFLSDSVKLRDEWPSEKTSLIETVKASFGNVSPDLNFHFIDLGDARTSAESPSETLRTYHNVVVGGTFDRLHTGHKLLLNECCLRCDSKLTIGITDGERNKKKTLWELMEPFALRKQGVVNFLEDVKPTIAFEPAQIFDAFGPTITDPNFDCIVVSEETKAGGAAVNTEREKRGFSILDTVIIDLVDDECRAPDEEEKVSSSSQRKRLLGTLLKPLPHRGNLSRTPYRIGLTGGIASGKSNVCSEMEKLGAKVINFDHLGHKAYAKGTAAYKAILEEFGNHLVDEDGNIARKQLGEIVFADKTQLQKLDRIVWPAIRELAEEEIASLKAAGASVVILEAAVLLEAGWQDMAHEVWTTFVPKEEAIMRLYNRNKMSRTDAEHRLDSQMSNEDRIAQANVVICPVWEYEVTRKQVQKAWNQLQERIKAGPTGNKL